MKQITTLLFALLLTVIGSGQTCYEIPKYQHTISGHDIGQSFMACNDADLITVTTSLATTYATTNEIEFRVYDQNNIVVGSQSYTVNLPVWVYPQGGVMHEFTFYASAPINGGQYYKWELSYCCDYVNPDYSVNEIICGRTAISEISGNAYFNHYNADGTPYYQVNQVKDIYAKVELKQHGCEGDFNGDNQVDNTDAAIIAAQYGMPCLNITTDMDGDCDVDDMDLDIFKKLLGTKCN
jgi:hypothetical protein